MSGDEPEQDTIEPAVEEDAPEPPAEVPPEEIQTEPAQSPDPEQAVSPQPEQEPEPEPEPSPVFDQTQPEPEQTHISQTRSERSSQIEMIAKSLLGGEDVSILTPSDVNPVLNYLTIYRNQHIQKQEVDEAEKADRVIASIQLLRNNAMREAVRGERESRIEERLNEARQFAEDLERRYKETRKNVLKENSEHIDALNEKHQQERDELPSKWQSPEKVRQYSHASGHLMTLRTQRILLMNARRYDEQRKADQAVSELEARETEENARAMMTEYENQVKLMNERQRQEMDHLLMANESRLLVLKRVEDKEVSAARRRVQNIEIELAAARDSDKVWNVYGRNERATTPASRGVPASTTTTTTSGSKRKRGRSSGPNMNMKDICSLKLPPLRVNNSRTTSSTKNNKR